MEARAGNEADEPVATRDRTDISGTKIGKFTIIKPAYRIKRRESKTRPKSTRIVYETVCECDSILYLRKDELRSRSSKPCCHNRSKLEPERRVSL